MASDETEDKASGTDGDNTTGTTAEEPKQPGFISRTWAATGLNLGQVLVMMKGALPPVIALSAYQGDAWARKYTTLGYLVAIMSLLGFSIMPRAKFTQTILLDILFVCIGAAVATLEMFCAVKARQATSGATATSMGASGSLQASTYNSSASTVSAIWFFVTIYLSNMLRAKRPQLQLPVIIYSIFTIVASAYSPLFTSMTQVYAFVKRLLETFLTGFGIAAAVSYFVYPTTSRSVVQKQMGGFLHLLSASLKAQQAYINKLRRHRKESMPIGEQPEAYDEALSEEAQTVKSLHSQVAGIFAKFSTEVVFAKREWAYGYLEPQDFTSLVNLCREAMLPISGLTTFIDIIESVKKRKRDEVKMIKSNETIEAIRKLALEEWNEAITTTGSTYGDLVTAIHNGLQHVIYTLQFEPKPKKAKGDEETGGSPAPGDKDYVKYLEHQLESFAGARKATMQDWCERKGISLPTSFWDDPNFSIPLEHVQSHEMEIRQRQNQEQLYLILFLEYLTLSFGKGVLAMVRWAESKVEDGTMKRKRMIFPAVRRFRKWAMALFAADADETDDGFATGMQESADIWAGDSYRSRKDPEHLPPTTFIQKITNPIRAIPELLRSEESSLGFRVAVGTMSLGILNFLGTTQGFFVRQRGIWAVIMTAISMSSHTGLGILGYIMRIGGTALAMCTSLVIWYMCDKKTAAILPVMYVFMVPFFYVVIKYPRYGPAAMISMVTPNLIIGYELQTRKIGLRVAESNGQPAYPIYELAPYRLAAVVAGIGVAFFWTYIPYPVTTRLTLRKQVGATIYLLANYYSCVHTTIQMRLSESVRFEDESKKGTPASKLKKARQKVFAKLVILLSSAEDNSNLTRLEPTFGGKFPKETYDDLIQNIRRIFRYITLMSYATNTFTTTMTEEESDWLRDFRHFASEIDLLSHDITSMLCLLSASLENSHPLPPYLRPPHAYDLDKRLHAIDPEILSIRHINEPCYAAFAVLQVASSLITDELQRTVELIRMLVGEVDFSFHIVSTNRGERDGDAKSWSSGSTTVTDSGGNENRNENGNGTGNGKKGSKRD